MSAADLKTRLANRIRCLLAAQEWCGEWEPGDEEKLAVDLIDTAELADGREHAQLRAEIERIADAAEASATELDPLPGFAAARLTSAFRSTAEGLRAALAAGGGT